MRQADAQAIAWGYPSLLLMEAAGRAVAQTVEHYFPNRPVVVLAGKGNNGGDGLVAARYLQQAGRSVRVFAAQSRTPDAIAMRKALELHLTIEPLEQFRLAHNCVAIDALFGTGLKEPLDGLWLQLCQTLNASGLPVVAIDIPSGMPYPNHIQAHCTVALAGLKPEHLFYPLRSDCGRIVLAHIGLPPAALDQAGLPELLAPQSVQSWLPSRPGNAHKGLVGRVLILGGHARYTGAPALAAWGALKAGAGLVTVAYEQGLPLDLPLEAVRHPVATWNQAHLDPAKATALAIGMGAGGNGLAMVQAALALGCPAVLDADALHPAILTAWSPLAPTAVITPHPGEAARLLGWSTEEVGQKPLEAAKALSLHYGVTAVLKGGPTVIAQGERLAVNTTGNPGMASGGMGDVLSGIIAAYLATGLAPFEAACLGVFLHGLAADQLGYPGFLASQVAQQLPLAAALLQQGQVRPFWEVLP